MQILNQFPYNKTVRRYAQVPTLLELPEVYRVYFGTRPNEGYSVMSYCDLDKTDLHRVRYVHDESVLTDNPNCTFDRHGRIPACTIAHQNKIYLYYTGLERQTDTPFCNQIGLAISEDNGAQFKRFSNKPILGISSHDPMMTFAPWIIPWHNKFLMFYTSGRKWQNTSGKLQADYSIKTAISEDLIHWAPQDFLPFAKQYPQYILMRPSAILKDDAIELWFCYRSGQSDYRMACAQSTDCLTWTVDFKPTSFIASNQAWDLSMQAYPCIFKHFETTKLLYCGNGFGEFGFGVANLK